jgi:hypothetical protein
MEYLKRVKDGGILTIGILANGPWRNKAKSFIESSIYRKPTVKKDRVC